MQRKGPERPTGASGAGFVRLFARERPRIVAKLRRLGVHEADADELAQRVFLQYAQLSGAPRNPAEWLLRTAWFLAMNWRRLTRHKVEVLMSGRDLQRHALDPSSSPEERAALGEWLDRAERLPPVEGAALRLHLEGYSIEQMARRLETSRATAWKRLTSARKALVRGR
ncbi:RNA polymerase sigma factor [Polyangium jinanense]|uniref:RNA polymerase sigma factor n=1 Tax=Polyangium jinanense TaxID=2829994 RepID=A0A9X3XGU4_9BACT|nr:RNA polymerase sigma factor [Polyangium jinanense]MDC3962866.1 RNA polymerase sigma factor [Polyangium jinanense]MDC3989250.1 RNA polymerase sigma factor [Polyangium jinanense]